MACPLAVNSCSLLTQISDGVLHGFLRVGHFFHLCVILLYIQDIDMIALYDAVGGTGFLPLESDQRVRDSQECHVQRWARNWTEGEERERGRKGRRKGGRVSVESRVREGHVRAVTDSCCLASLNCSRLRWAAAVPSLVGSQEANNGVNGSEKGYSLPSSVMTATDAAGPSPAGL